MAAAGELKPGREVRVPVFDPSARATRRAVLRVVRRETLVVADSVEYDRARDEWRVATVDTLPVFRLEEKVGGVVLASWVDREGRLVRAESPSGFTIERTAYELVRQERKSRPPHAAALASRDLPDAPAPHRSAKSAAPAQPEAPARPQLRLRGVALPELARFLVGGPGRQSDLLRLLGRIDPQEKT
jgi:hypothetical protein